MKQWLRVAVVVSALAAACALHTARDPAFKRGVWRVRIDIDSTPTRRLPKNPVFGTIDFAAARHAIDFMPAIGRRLPPGAYVVTAPRQAPDEPTTYRITLGDSTSFDEKLAFFGRAVTDDSVVGTWTETNLCCAAAGRFALWRVPRER